VPPSGVTAGVLFGAIAGGGLVVAFAVVFGARDGQILNGAMTGRLCLCPPHYRLESSLYYNTIH